jgi:hypothetical protein
VAEKTVGILRLAVSIDEGGEAVPSRHVDVPQIESLEALAHPVERKATEGPRSGDGGLVLVVSVVG